MANTISVKNAYEIIKELGLSNDFSLEYFNKYYEQKLKDNFLLIEGEEIYYIYQFLYDQKIAFSVDWKWEPSDLLYGVKLVTPEFKKLYKVLTEEEDNVNKVWNLKVKLGKNEFEMKPSYEDPKELVEKINEVLKDLCGKVLLRWDDSMDSFAYILIPATGYERLSNKYPVK